MKMMKKAVLASALLLAFQQEAMAHDNTATLNAAELTAAFDSSVLQSKSLATLSPQEMEETQGAVLPFVIGAGIGLGSYGIQNMVAAYSVAGCYFCTRFTNNYVASWNNRSAIVSTGVGALSGGLSAIALRGSGVTINYARTTFLRTLSAPRWWQRVANNQVRTYTTAPGLAIKSAAFVGSHVANTAYAKIAPQQVQGAVQAINVVNAQLATLMANTQLPHIAATTNPLVTYSIPRGVVTVGSMF